MEYLYMLQTLREGAGSGLTPFFFAISEFVITGGPIILAFVYWCVDKRIGAWGMFNMTLGSLANDVVKLTACVNRPWVQDPRLHVEPAAAGSATGYSFPSGHAAIATATYGSIAFWQRGKRTWVTAIMVVLVLLTALARNWLGAHTLQDVCAALALVAAVMVVTSAVMRHLDAHPQRDVAFAALVVLLCAVAALYVSFKPYPLEYTSAGVLLVDPRDMTPDFWGSVGLASGWAISWVVERRFIRFDCGGTRGRKAVRFLAGAALFGIVYLVAMPALVAGLDPNLAKFLKRFVTIVVAGCLYPAIVKFVQVRSTR